MALEGTALTVALYASAAVAVAGTAYSIVQQNKANKASKKADEAKARIADLENQRAVREQQRKLRANRASAIAAGETNLGGATSSSLEGGLAAATTGTAANIGHNQQLVGLNGYANSQTSEANQALANANNGQSLASLGSTVFSELGGGARLRAQV